MTGREARVAVLGKGNDAIRRVTCIPAGMKVIRGVLLDLDGTLLDSNDAHAAAWREALAEQGILAEHDELRRLIGMGADELLPKLGLSDGEDPGKTAKGRSGAIFREKHVAGLKPQREARQLVMLIRDRHIKRIVATSSSKENVALLLKATGIEDLVDDETNASDAHRSKPNPDIVQAAIRRSGLLAANLALLGDTPYDVAAGRAAGVPVLCLRCGGWNDEALAGAAEIYDDPADLIAHFEQSLLAR